MTLELFVDSRHLSPYALSAFVALRHKGVPFELKTVDLEAHEHLDAAYRSRSLTARVPMLVADGWALSESSAIAEYIDEAWPGPRLYPSDPRQRARARQLQAWLRSDLGELRAARNTEGVFLGRRLPPMNDAARRQAGQVVQVAETLIEPEQGHLFDAWCIADVDLALMLMRLISQDDPVPAHLIQYAWRQWQRTEVLQWLGLPRQTLPEPRVQAWPTLEGIDHVHVFVSDRHASEGWYERVLGMRRVPSLETWAVDGGPLTLADAQGGVHIALFEAPPQANRSTIAMRTDGQAFIAWRCHLEQALGAAPRLVDHDLSWSLYFSDPDGNPFEITTYDREAVTEAGPW
jgi:glutathione S-transferase